jgi:hypothetical protein
MENGRWKMEEEGNVNDEGENAREAMGLAPGHKVC